MGLMRQRTVLCCYVAAPTRSQLLAWSSLQLAAFVASAACHALAFGSLVVSVDMAGRSLRHKLVCRA